MISKHKMRIGLRVFTAAGLAILIPSDDGRAVAAPRFERTACDLPDIGDVSARLRCGTVRVPRDYAHPDGPTYALAVVVIASAIQPAQPDPVVYISGGPGGPITIYSGYQARHPYAPDRDLILVDQRGMGRSEPRLCPEMQSTLVDAMVAVATDPTTEALDADRQAHVACRDAIRGRGIDLDTFGTAATVEDFEWVRQALDIPRWNVVGESYGTTVTMTLMAHHPEAIRSVVLDSLNPPDAYFTAPWSARVASARESFFAACRADRGCSTFYPDLTATYRETVERLGRDAPPVSLPAALHVSGDVVRLTPSLFEEVVGRLVYYPPFYPGLPGLVVATSNGDLVPIREALTTLLTGAKQAGNQGAFVTVECRDRPRWREEMADRASALDLALLPPGVCADWSALGPGPEVPRNTKVPTLVLQGEFDPNSRPDDSRRVIDELGSNARRLDFAGTGHSVRHHSTCAQALVAAFIGLPDRVLDAVCASERPKITFRAVRSQ